MKTIRAGKERIIAKRITVTRMAITVMFSLPMLSAPAALSAPFDISDVPLFLGGTLEPNLLYIHDDSGSMYWSFLPDGLSCGPQRGTSHSYNLQYFNPTVTYVPPLDHNGNSLGDASFTNAWFDGYNVANRHLNTFDLSSNFRATWGYDGSWCGEAQAAYYHEFSPPQTSCDSITNQIVTNNACYVKQTVPVAEQQNFANWYSYYRTRNYSSKAGISRAFADVGSKIRIGYGRLNKETLESRDGKSVRVIERGVRKFEGSERQEFFDWLFTAPASGGTPLRRALDSAGSYYQNDSEIGPWSTTPGVTGGNLLSCRKSFTILMTDGYWNGAITTVAPGVLENNDGTVGPTISGPGGTSYTYGATGPFADSYNSALADIAMYYWKNDLSSLANRVPTTPSNPAFWQHMVTYGIGFGVQGTIDPITAFNAVGTGAAIPWLNPTSYSDNHPSKIDDLLHAAVNSRGGFYSANDPEQFATALTQTLASINASTGTASRATVNSTRLESSSMIYQATFDSGDWTGEFYGFQLNPSNGDLITPAAWTASAGIPAHNVRNVLTWKPGMPGSGADFVWTDLTATQRAELNDSSAVLDFLRGSNSNEGTGATQFRIRNSKLGDIVNSSAALVGSEDFGYATATSIPTAEQNAYRTRGLSSAFLTRPKTIYVGANDGMLHAFNASDGIERFAFVPNSLFAGGKLLKLTAQDYEHLYYVDGSPRAADAYIAGNWRTVLVGSTGAGGRSYFALDVEDAVGMDKTKVLWEFEHTDLGFTIGQASVVRTESGHWVAIFGNGYNSDSHKAQLFVVDVATGALLAKIDTGVGSAAAPNGLSTPLAIDVDFNGSVDLVYAGDMYGNLWKFDFTGNGPSHWGVAFNDSGIPKPLFKTVGPNAEVQPITAKPTAAIHPAGGVIVYFGTGKYFEVGDQGAISDTQSLYGVIDDCVENVSGSCAGVSGPAKVLRTELQQQTIFFEQISTFTNVATGDTHDHDVRLVSKNDASGKKGFYLDLISPLNGQEGERYLGQPRVWNDRVQFVTMIPDPDPCSAGGTSWFMELDPFTGGRTDFSVFDLNSDGGFDSYDFIADPSTGTLIPVSGRRNQGGIASDPVRVTPAGSGPKVCYEYSTDSGGNFVKNVVPCDAQVGRRSWRQIR